MCAGSRTLHIEGKTIYSEDLCESCQINDMYLETIQRTEIAVRTVNKHSSSGEVVWPMARLNKRLYLSVMLGQRSL